MHQALADGCVACGGQRREGQGREGQGRAGQGRAGHRRVCDGGDGPLSGGCKRWGGAGQGRAGRGAAAALAAGSVSVDRTPLSPTPCLPPPCPPPAPCPLIEEVTRMLSASPRPPLLPPSSPAASFPSPPLPTPPPSLPPPFLTEPLQRTPPRTPSPTSCSRLPSGHPCSDAQQQRCRLCRAAAATAGCWSLWRGTIAWRSWCAHLVSLVRCPVAAAVAASSCAHPLGQSRAGQSRAGQARGSLGSLGRTTGGRAVSTAACWCRSMCAKWVPSRCSVKDPWPAAP